MIQVAINHNLNLTSISEMTSEEMVAYVRSTRNAVKASVKTDRNNTNRAAYATWLAEFKLGILGKSNKDNAGYMIDGDWAESFEKTRTITGAWRTAGRCLVDLKIDPDSDVWMRFRNSNIYQTTDGKAVVAKATPETAVADLEAFMDGKVDAHGKRIKKPRTAQNNEEDREAARKAAAELDGKVGEFVAEVGKDMTIVETALLLLASLDKVIKDADHDEFAVVTEAITALVERKNEAFAKDLKAAAKAKRSEADAA